MAISIDEVSTRLQRIHAAVGSTIERDMSKFRPQISPNLMYLDFRGGMSDEDIQNIAWGPIHNTAIFYNYLRNWATENKALKAEIKETHQNSQPLLIIRDLDNNNKHPEAEGRINTSGLFPKLVGVTRVARISGSGGFFLGPGGSPVTQGDVKVIIEGDIVNAKSNKKIGLLSATLDDAVKTWEDFMDSKGLL